MTPPVWHNLSIEQTLDQQHTSVNGLDAREAERRLQQSGLNVLPGARRRSVIVILLRQFTDFLIIVLLIAALISGVIGEPQDTIAILLIILINAIIGTVQEYRAEKAVAALREMAAPDARVIRGGAIVTVPSAELVPGDVVVLETGNVVPADLRLIDIEEIQLDESALTGESNAVDKNTETITDSELTLGDRFNMVFKGSLVTRGRGKGVVVATGMATEIGQIAELLQTEKSVKTPLQKRLSRFGRYLALAVIAICAIVFVAGLLQGQPLLLMFMTAISLAVAAIPEALPAVVTVSLAFGAHKLIHQHALVRNLPAVETLGSVTYICTDKTGTLTENRMTVEQYLVLDKRYDRLDEIESKPLMKELAQAMALNNDIAFMDHQAAGEATELALYKAAEDAGFNKSELETEMPRISVIAFDSARKQMTTLHQRASDVVAYVKGAPEKLLDQCINRLGDSGTEALDTQQILEQANQFALEGYRVLALARRELPSLPTQPVAEEIETRLTFMALVALIDPPRTEVPQAVSDCLTAGITPVMITGDHPGTAMAIAQRLGIASDDDSLITGDELVKLNDHEFSHRVEHIRVYARVSPKQKLRIVKALQENGEFVAMTGDGVNDAPALKRAGIGVAMGQKGTDVAREAADMVLLDDNFSTIVHAVKSGRRIFDNIRKFIKYTMSSNSGEIWTLFLAPFLGLPIPLLPIHILWINLITDGLPGLAYAAEPAEPNIMQRPPRPTVESIFSHGMWQYIIWVGLLIGGLSIASQAWAISRGVEYWQTIVFTVLTVSQLFHSLAVRSESASLLSIGLFSNKPMLGAVLLTILLQMMVIYLPFFNGVFHTQPLPVYDLVACFAISSLVLVAVEVRKKFAGRSLSLPVESR